MLAYALVAIGKSLVTTTLAFAFLLPRMLEVLLPTIPAAHRAALEAMTYGGGACGAIFELIFPVLVLIFFNRKYVVNAFQGIYPASPTNFPVTYPETAGPSEF